MARRIGLLAAFALSLTSSACASVSVEMAEPKYATRLEDLLPQERAPAPGPARAERPRAEAPAETRAASDRPPGAPAFRPEPIATEELPPLDDQRTSDRGRYEDERYDNDRYVRRDPPRAGEGRDPESRPAAAGADLQYIVQPGDTLSGISRRFDVSPARIIELNGLTPQGALRSGQALILPSGAMDYGVDPYAMGPAPRGVRPAPGVGLAQQSRGLPAPSRAEVPPPPPPPPPPVASTSRAAADTGDRSRGSGRFIWPVRGEILSPFGSAGPGLRNDGINIAAPEGEAVKAAAAGEVVYAGSAVPEFGNLVLIKHEDGWVTAYGHLGSIDVKMRDRVTQGQRIGSVGTSGGVPRPQLHFEMRHAPSALVKAAPVDPVPILP